ncbi:orotidine-5'-phosphate decarboxylase [Streptomyces sp. NPDC004561]
MTARVGSNGFGRIGRAYLREALARARRWRKGRRAARPVVVAARRSIGGAWMRRQEEANGKRYAWGDQNDVMEPTSQIIVALDCDHRAAAQDIVDKLGDECRYYKVGLELLTAAGPGLIKHLVARGKEVFLDLKLFEIPNSVAGAVRAAGALGVSMVTVHSMGGTGIMAAAVDAARDFPELRVLALTVVTSMTDSDLADIGVGSSTESQVLRLAGLAEQAGCHGVIASPQEVSALRGLLGDDALIVTPGVALPGDSPGEHARPGTPRAAIAAGASHVVVGRTVTRAVDPASAFRLVHGSLRP